MSFRRLLGMAGLAALSAFAPGFASAQSLGAYDPIGAHVGSFFFYPGLDASLSTNSNIYAAPHGTSDTVATLTPFATLRSDWGRNALNLDARLIGSYYFEHSSENTTAAAVAADGRIDIDRSANLFGSLRAADLFEPRSSAPQTAILAKPTEYQEYTGQAGAVRAFNRIRLIATVGFDNFNYNNNQVVGGPVFSEKDRNHTMYTGSLRSELTVSPATFLFGEIDLDADRYKLNPPLVSVSREANGYTLLGGVRYDLTHLLVGQIGVGYFSQDYKQAGFKTSSGLALNTNVTWNVTPLISLTGIASRQVKSAGIAGASAYVTTEGGVNAVYEWRRNVSFHVGADYAQDKYVGVSRTDDRTTFNGGADWKLNRNLGLYAQASYLKQTSSGVGAGRDFNDKIGTIGVRLRY